MAISPIGLVGASPLPASNNGDRRSASRALRTTTTVPSTNGDLGDRVVVSETARGIAAATAQAEDVQLQLSPAELRAMITPRPEDEHLKSAPATDDSSRNTEERHVR